MPHSLPSARLLADFQAFFTSATLLPNGKVKVTLTLPKEEREATLDLSDNDGMILNVSVWETALPEGEDDLARALGVPVMGSGEVARKMVAKS